jgi:hypothetical protein
MQCKGCEVFINNLKGKDLIMDYRETEDAAIKVIAALTKTHVTVDSVNLDLFEAFTDLVHRDEKLMDEFPSLQQLIALALTTRLEECDIKDFDSGLPDSEIYERVKERVLPEIRNKIVPFSKIYVIGKILKNSTACWLLFEIQNLKAMVDDPDDFGCIRLNKAGSEYTHTMTDTIDNLYSVFFDLVDLRLTEEDYCTAYDFIDTEVKLTLNGLKFEINIVE